MLLSLLEGAKSLFIRNLNSSVTSCRFQVCFPVASSLFKWLCHRLVELFNFISASIFSVLIDCRFSYTQSWLLDIVKDQKIHKIDR